MLFQQQLRVPGPAPVPERVVRAASAPMINHRGAEFAELISDVTQGLKDVFQTQNEMLILTASGTGGLESAVANVISPGDQVLVASCGSFGDRFAQIATVYGAQVVHLSVPWGQPVEAADLKAILAEHPAVRVVFLTHNETSTGLTNPITDLCEAVRSHGALLVVDGVSSVASIDLPVDRLGIDVAVSSSQKGWMCPPGLAFVSVSARAWEMSQSAKAPRFYFDWAKARDSLASGQTPYTPAIGIFMALREGLAMIKEEGLANVFVRHQLVAAAFRAGVEALGLDLFAHPAHRSATVTCGLMPEGIAGSALIQRLRTGYGVVVAGGQGQLQGKIFRIGHLGMVAPGDVVQVLWALQEALRDVGYDGTTDGSALVAAQNVLRMHDEETSLTTGR